MQVTRLAFSCVGSALKKKKLETNSLCLLSEFIERMRLMVRFINLQSSSSQMQVSLDMVVTDHIPSKTSQMDQSIKYAILIEKFFIVTITPRDICDFLL